MTLHLKHKLSVALCTYNGELYIKQQLESIIKQTRSIDEIIIYDDNSTDKTRDIIKEIIKRNTQIKIELYVNENNIGVIRNFERAINKCSGDIIFLSDQDDIWVNSKVQTIVEHFDNHPNIELIFTNATIINSHSKTIPNATLFKVLGFEEKNQRLWEKGMYIEILSLQNRITGATIAFKKTLIKGNIKFDEDIDALHDEQLAIKAINNKSISFITNPLLSYRIHNNNVCGFGKNWSFKENNYQHLYKIQHPYSPKSLYKILPRYDFQLKRSTCIYTLKGRFTLFLSILTYIKLYKNYFLKFYLYDLFTGLLPYFMNRLKLIK